MNSKVEKLPKSKVKVTITVEPEEMIKYFNVAYDRLSPNVKLDGFRPGKAPRPLTESTIGVTRIISEAMDDAINENYIKVLKEEKLNPITSPAVKINKYPLYGQIAEEVKNPLEFEMEFLVLPEVKLGDYAKIKIEKPAKESPKAEEVEKILQNLQKQKASFEEVDRAAEMGDMAEVSFEGFLRKVRIDAMCSKNHPVVLGEKSLIPGFEEEIAGMKKGEKKNFKIKFPKDYHSKEFAGKDAEFTVELNNLKKVNLSPVDEAFAADFGHKSVSDLKKAIEKNLELEYMKKYDTELESKILEKLLPLVKTDIPQELVEKETDRMIHDYEHQLQSMGMNFESYLKSMNKSADDIRKDMKQTAEKNVKIGLMLGKVIEEQKIDPQDPTAGKKAIEHLVMTMTK